ncbi:MAG: hypothetical protein HY306_12600 [Nitrosomonadales bacterium]|nr:hypothetical protein [Nitrosomonadales bacterium]
MTFPGISLKQLVGALCAGLLFSAANAAPPTIDHKRGGSVSITVAAIPAGMQLALVPGGPYSSSIAAMQTAVLSLASDEHHAYVAAGDGGLLVFELATGTQPRLLASFKGQGRITLAVLRDGYAYLADSAGALLIVDVHDPRQPQLRGRYALMQPLDALCVEQGRAYLASGKQLDILDVSNPQMPTRLAGSTLEHDAHAIQLADGYAYIAQLQAGLGIYDARDPAHIREAGRFHGDVKDVAVVQGRAYLANGATGLTVLDVSTPQAPHWLGSANHIGASLALSYDDGYVALRDERSEITFVDVHNPRMPKVVALQHAAHVNTIALSQKQVLTGTDEGIETVDFSAPVPNVVNIGANFGGSRRAVIRDNILFVADWFSGLHLYDISDPVAPRHLANYHTQGSSKGVLVRGGYAFVADDDHGVQILDISNPKQPRKISEVATPGLAYTMKLVGDYLYLADHRGGFHIISVADIAHPSIVGSAQTAGKAWAVEIVGNLAYVAADSAGLLVFDISDPQQPRQLAAYDVGGAAEDVVIREHFAYVASFDNGLHIFDISAPLQAREISHLLTPGNARGIELDGDLAYIADWVSGVQIVNVSNPAQPFTLGSYDTIGWSWGVRVQGQYAYVLDWWGGIAVLDVSNPATPTLAGAYHARGQTRDVTVRDNYAYVADGSNGLQIFDVKNPLNPIWMAGVDFAGDAQSVVLAGNVAYLAAGTGGLATVDISNPFEPRLRRQFATPSDVVRAQGNVIYAAQRQHGVAMLDADSGQFLAWHDAQVNDMWLAGDRLLLATQSDVEILDVSDPQHHHPRMFKQLPQRADLVRLQNNLLVLYDKATGISLYDYATLKLRGRFNPGEEILDVQISGKRLYASGSESGLLELDISDARHPLLRAAYPAASRVTGLSAFSGSVFMAGNETLAEVRLLPDVAIKRGRHGAVTVTTPRDMPLGSYHLLAFDTTSGKRLTYNDIFRVAMPPSKKPRFTMQDLEREMRKRGLDPATHQ